MQGVVCGIDMSSEELEACILLGEEGEEEYCRTFNNTKRGIRGLLSWLKEHKVELVVMEAVGGYERLCFRMLRDKKIRAQVVNPSRIRHFALGMGKIAKTDKLDAQVIARFGQVVNLEELGEVSEVELELKELIQRREELKEMLVAERNRLRLAEGVKERSIKRVIKILEKELKQINERIKEVSGKDERMKRGIEVWRSRRV